jgi:Ribonuclease D
LQKYQQFQSKRICGFTKIAPTFNIEVQSVRKLAAIVLGARVSKTQQLSNWESTELTGAQIDYAATDAWVCREIFVKFKAINPSMVTQ